MFLQAHEFAKGNGAAVEFGRERDFDIAYEIKSSTSLLGGTDGLAGDRVA